MTTYYDTIDTQFGPFSLAVDDEDRVIATAFGGRDELLRLRGVHEDALVEDKKRPAASLKQVREYFEGKRNDFDLPLSADGTPFQRRVWDALCTIPHGETRSYGWLAKQVGSSPRAVGGANGSNPIGLIVPCHRVIGADGSLTGFGWGVDVKKNLLDFESQQKTLV